MVKDSFIFNCRNYSNDTQKKCVSCFSNAHLTLYCPLLQHIPDREKIIKKYEFSHIQERETFKRMRLRSKNSLGLQKNSIKIACKLQKELKKSATLFNFTHLRAIINIDSPLDSNMFDSKNSLPSIENFQSSRSSSSEIDIETYNEENLKEVAAMKESIRKIYDKMVTEVGVKRTHLLEEMEGIEMKESNGINATMKDTKEILDVGTNPQKSLLDKQICFDQMLLRDKPGEHNKKEHANINKNLTILSDSELKKTTSKQQSQRIEKKTSNITKNITNNNYNNNSVISVTKVSTLNNNTILSRVSSNQTPSDGLGGFEKGENFDHYFPSFNLDKILQIYDKKRRKLAFLRRFHPQKRFSSSFREKTHNFGNLKNFSKYSFYPLNPQKNKKEGKSIESAKSIEKECKSPFFNKKEFKKKTTSFRVLVQDLISNKNKKMTQKPE